MGTRSLTYVYNGTKADMGKPMVCMYRQFDGYPEGHGEELANFLLSGNLVNGIPANNDERLFNGMGCLAAQLVCYFKKDCGGIYLYAPELNQDCWQEYEYHVYSDRITLFNGSGEHLFTGPWSGFLEFCKNPVTEE